MLRNLIQRQQMQVWFHLIEFMLRTIDLGLVSLANLLITNVIFFMIQFYFFFSVHTEKIKSQKSLQTMT